jgi:glycosyltransferase involved in cell wall biosynthesis
MPWPPPTSETSTRSARPSPPGPEVWPDGVERRRALDHPELRRLYNKASVIVVPVLPTAYPFGITTLLEAMSMGKAVVVPDTEGLRGVVEDGRTGVVVPPGDAFALSDAVGGLLGDSAARARLGHAARQAAVRRFGLDLFVDELGRHLHELSGHDAVMERRP